MVNTFNWLRCLPETTRIKNLNSILERTRHDGIGTFSLWKFTRNIRCQTIPSSPIINHSNRVALIGQGEDEFVS